MKYKRELKEEAVNVCSKVFYGIGHFIGKSCKDLINGFEDGKNGKKKKDEPNFTTKNE